jgi:hypothetical protein
MKNKYLLRLFLADIIDLYYKYHNNDFKSMDTLEEIDSLGEDYIHNFTIDLLKKIDISKMRNCPDFYSEIIRASYQVDCYLLLEDRHPFLLIIRDWLNIQKRFINELRNC